MSLGVFPSERAFTVGGDVTQVGPFWVIFDRGSGHCARPTSASPRLCCKSRFAQVIKNSAGCRRVFRVKT